MRGISLIGLGLGLGLGLVAACSPATTTTNGPKSGAPVTAAATGSADAFAFSIGALQAFAVKDGDIHIPNDGKVLGSGQPKAAVDAVLTEAKLSTETLDLSIQPLLVKDGQRAILFDTGAGSASFAVAGRLPQSLRSAGVEPAQVTDIFLSHGHPDHTGGIVGKDGALQFANATIHLSSAEWESMKANKDQASLVAAMTPKVATFEPNAKILPSVTAVDAHGHTPGHSAYDIASGSDHVLYVGDSVHHSVISVERPDWSVKFDQSDADAKASRRALLERSAKANARLYGVHFPFPGVGHVRPHGEGFTWVPEAAR